jgi:nitrite reductase/ring-hydroxylating ferredoxin subunit
VSREAVRHDVEEALRAGLLGFQELVLGERAAAGPVLIQIGGLRSAQRPVYRRACAAIDVPPGQMSAVDVEGQPILIVNVDGQLHAVMNRCGDTPLPLHFGTVQGAELRCSWHGCRYDVRTGKRLDGGTEHLSVVPVAIEGDEIRVAVGVRAGRGALTVRTLIAGFGNVLRATMASASRSSGGCKSAHPCRTSRSWKWGPPASGSPRSS